MLLHDSRQCPLSCFEVVKINVVLGVNSKELAGVLKEHLLLGLFGQGQMGVDHLSRVPLSEGEGIVATEKDTILPNNLEDEV